MVKRNGSGWRKTLDYNYLGVEGDFLVLRDSSGYEIYDTQQKKMLVYNIANGIRKIASDQVAEINNNDYLYGYLNLQTGAFSGYYYRVVRSASWPSAKMLEDGRAAIVVRNYTNAERSSSEICCLNENMKNWKLEDAWDDSGAFVNDDLTVTISTEPECSTDLFFNNDEEKDYSGRMGVFDSSGQQPV